MRRFAACLIITLIAGFMANCSATPPSRHYLLTPLSIEASGKPTAADQTSRLTVVVMPVRIPPYLNRPQMVTRTGSNEMHIDEFNRWASPFEDNIADVLARNLSSLLPKTRFARHPVPAALPVAYSVFVDIFRFEGIPGQSVAFLANWAVVAKGERSDRRVTFQTYDKTLTVDGQGYGSLVATQSRMLADFSREIAQALADLPTGGSSARGTYGKTDPQ